MKQILIILLSSVFIGHSGGNNIYYCIAKDGVLLHHEPSVNSKKISVIPFGDSMTHLRSYYLEYKDTLLVKGKPYDGYWDKVVYKGDTGYVFNAYIYSVNPILKTEYLYHHTVFSNNSIGIDFDSDHRGDGRASRGFDYERIVKGFKDYTKVNQDDVDTLTYANSLDSLKKYIKFEIVNPAKYPFNPKYNLFKIDTTHVEINVPFDTSNLNYSFRGEYISPDVNSFDLKLNNGKRLHFQDAVRMFGEHVRFIGRIKALNAYVVEFTEELGPIYQYYSIDDGKLILSGSPSSYISANKRYIIDFSYEDIGRDEPAVILNLAHLDETLNKDNYLYTEIEFWSPSFKPSDAYWVSNTELIIPFLPNHLFFRSPTYTGNDDEIEWQYIKLTIL